MAWLSASVPEPVKKISDFVALRGLRPTCSRASLIDLLGLAADRVEGRRVAEMLPAGTRPSCPRRPGRTGSSRCCPDKPSLRLAFVVGKYRRTILAEIAAENTTQIRIEKKGQRRTSAAGERGCPRMNSGQLFLEDPDDFEAGPLLAFLGLGADVGRGGHVRMVDERPILGRLLGEDVEGGGLDLAGVRARRGGPSRRRRRRGRR